MATLERSDNDALRDGRADCLRIAPAACNAREWPFLTACPVLVHRLGNLRFRFAINCFAHYAQDDLPIAQLCK